MTGGQLTCTAFTGLHLDGVRTQEDKTLIFDFRQDNAIRLVLAVADPNAGLAEIRLSQGKQYAVSFREMTE